MEKEEEKTIRASLDRFEENGYGVVYTDDGKKFDIKRELIPESVKEGSRVKIHFQDSKVSKVVTDDRDAQEVKRKIREKLERLKHNQHLK
jgi:uncharacterized protein YwgA